jgi:hypothetical protein
LEGWHVTITTQALATQEETPLSYIEFVFCECNSFHYAKKTKYMKMLTAQQRLAATLVRLASVGVGFHNISMTSDGFHFTFRIARANAGASFFRGEKRTSPNADLEWHMTNPNNPMYVAVDLETADFYQCQYQILKTGNENAGRVVEYTTTRELRLLDMSDPSTILNLAVAFLFATTRHGIRVEPSEPSSRASAISNSLAAVDEMFLAFGLSDQYVTMFKAIAARMPGVTAALLSRRIRKSYACDSQAGYAENPALFACNPDFPNHQASPVSRMSFFSMDKAFVQNLCRINTGFDGYLAVEMPTVDLEAVGGVFHAEMVICSPETSLQVRNLNVASSLGVSASVSACKRRVASFLKTKATPSPRAKHRCSVCREEGHRKGSWKCRGLSCAAGEDKGDDGMDVDI